MRPKQRNQIQQKVDVGHRREVVDRIVSARLVEAWIENTRRRLAGMNAGPNPKLTRIRRLMYEEFRFGVVSGTPSRRNANAKNAHRRRCGRECRRRSEALQKLGASGGVMRAPVLPPGRPAGRCLRAQLNPTAPTTAMGRATFMRRHRSITVRARGASGAISDSGTAIPGASKGCRPAIECRSAERFTPGIRACRACAFYNTCGLSWCGYVTVLYSVGPPDSS
jgi:hypothetical protein